MTNEVWKSIRGYKRLYEVSNFGRIKSLERKIHPEEAILKLFYNPNGYVYIILHKNGKGKNCRVHRLVAKTFIKNPYRKPEVNHIDTDKTNNKANNLEWLTKKEHLQHTLSHGLIGGPEKGEGHFNCKLTNKVVLAIFESKEPSIDLSKKLWIPESTISGIRIGKTWGHLTGKGLIVKKRNISEKYVLDIFNSNKSNKELATEYNVDQSTISAIKIGRNFGDITGKVYNPKKGNYGKFVSRNCNV